MDSRLYLVGDQLARQVHHDDAGASGMSGSGAAAVLVTLYVHGFLDRFLSELAATVRPDHQGHGWTVDPAALRGVLEAHGLIEGER